jgi:hypothetical protein
MLAMSVKALQLFVVLSAAFTIAARGAEEIVADIKFLDSSTSQPNPDGTISTPHRKLHAISASAPPPPGTNFPSPNPSPWWQALHANFSALAAQSDLPHQVIGHSQQYS